MPGKDALLMPALARRRTAFLLPRFWVFFAKRPKHTRVPPERSHLRQCETRGPRGCTLGCPGRVSARPEDSRSCCMHQRLEDTRFGKRRRHLSALALSIPLSPRPGDSHAPCEMAWSGVSHSVPTLGQVFQGTGEKTAQGHRARPGREVQPGLVRPHGHG